MLMIFDVIRLRISERSLIQNETTIHNLANIKPDRILLLQENPLSLLKLINLI